MRSLLPGERTGRGRRRMNRHSDGRQHSAILM
jgi:hypothetical protein